MLADAFADEIELSQVQLARWEGSGGAAMAGACCGRPLVATADLTAALQSSRGGSAARGGVGASTGRGEGPERARGVGSGTRRLACTHVQNARSGRAQSVQAKCSAKCPTMLGGVGGAGD